MTKTFTPWFPIGDKKAARETRLPKGKHTFPLSWGSIIITIIQLLLLITVVSVSTTYYCVDAATTPYNGTFSIPGLLQAEDFDQNGSDENSTMSVNTVRNENYRNDTFLVILQQGAPFSYVQNLWLQATERFVTSCSVTAMGNYSILVGACSSDISMGLNITFYSSTGSVVTAVNGVQPYFRGSSCRSASSGTYTLYNFMPVAYADLTTAVTRIEVKAYGSTVASTSVVSVDFLSFLAVATTDGPIFTVPDTISAADFIEDFDLMAFRWMPGDPMSNNGTYREKTVMRVVDDTFSFNENVTMNRTGLKLYTGEKVTYSLRSTAERLLEFSTYVRQDQNQLTRIAITMNGSTQGSNWDTYKGTSLYRSRTNEYNYVYVGAGENRFGLAVSYPTSTTQSYHPIFYNFTFVDVILVHSIPGAINGSLFRLNGSDTPRSTTSTLRADSRLSAVKFINRHHKMLIGSTEWVEYEINVATAGSYELGIALSKRYNNAVGPPNHGMIISLDGTPIMSDKVGQYDANQASQTQYIPVDMNFVVPLASLSTGKHTIRITGTGSYSYNSYYHYIETLYVLKPSAVYQGITNSIPGTIAAKNYDEGFQGLFKAKGLYAFGNSSYRAKVLPLYTLTDQDDATVEALRLASTLSSGAHYTATVSTDALYNVSVKLLGRGPSTAQVRVLVNGSSIGTQSLSDTANNFTVFYPSTNLVPLTSGSVKISVQRLDTYSTIDVYVQEVLFTQVRTISPKSISRKTIPATIAFIDFSWANDTDAYNTGNSSAREETTVDIDDTMYAPTSVNASVTRMGEAEVLEYDLYNPTAQFYKLSAAYHFDIASYTYYGGVEVYTEWVANGNTVISHAMTISVYGTYRLAMLANWTQEYYELYLPAGDVTLLFKMKQSQASDWAANFHLNQFTLTAAGRPFGSIPTLPAAFEAETFNVHTDGAFPTVDSGNSSFRTAPDVGVYDLAISPTENGTAVRVVTKSTAVQYFVYIPESVAGIQLRLHIRARNLNTTRATLVLRIGSNDGGFKWTVPFSQQSLSSIYSSNGWLLTSRSFTLPTSLAGYRILTAYLSADVIYYMDLIVVSPSSGPYEWGSTAGNRLSVDAWKFDYFTEYDRSSGNSGTEKLLRGASSTDVSRDENNALYIGNIEDSEYLEYTRYVTGTGPHTLRMTVITDEVDCVVKFYINGSRIGGRFYFPVTGLHVDRTVMDAMNLTETGDARFRFTLDSCVTAFYNFSLIPIAWATSVPYHAGILENRFLLGTEYDNGGNGYAYSTRSITSRENNVRSGDILTTVTENNVADSLYLSVYDSWVRYTFTMGWSGTTSFLLLWRGRSSSITSTLQIEGYEGTTLTFNKTISIRGFTILKEDKVHAFTATEGKTLTVVLRRVSGDSYINQLTFDSSSVILPESTCYTVGVLPCETREILSTSDCSRLSNLAINFPGTTVSTMSHCAATPGKLITLSPPSAVNSYGMVLLQVPTAKTALTEVTTAGTWTTGETVIQNSIARVVVTKFGFVIEAKDANGVGYSTVYTLSRSCSDVLFKFNPSHASTQFRLENSQNCLAASAGRTGTFVYRYMVLDQCRLYFMDKPHSQLNQAVKASYGQSTCGSETITKYQNKLEVEYSSGRIERVGRITYEILSDNVPYNVYFEPRGQQRVSAPTSMCEVPLGNKETHAVIGIPTSVKSSESVKSVRVLWYYNIISPVIAGVAWMVSNSEMCPAASFSEEPSLLNLATEVTIPATGIIKYYSSEKDCAHACASSQSCRMWSHYVTTCRLQKSYEPLSVLTTTSQGATAFVGIIPDTASSEARTRNEAPAIGGVKTLARAGDFPEALGWQGHVFLFIPGEKLEFPVTNVKGVALSVRSNHFAVKDDWVLLHGPGMMEQCGNSYSSFLGAPEIIGELSPDPGCGSKMVTCGYSEYSNTLSSATFSVLSRSANTNGCGASLGVLFVKGQLAAAAAPSTGHLLTTEPSVSAQGLISSSSMTLDGKTVYLAKYSSTSAAPSTAALTCTFAAGEGFTRRSNVRGAVEECTDDIKVLSLEDLARRCDHDSLCAGFTTQVLASGSEVAMCLARTTSYKTSTGFTVYEKRNPTSYKCSQVIDKAIMKVRIQVTLSNFADPHQFVTVRLNDTVVARCGGKYGFEDAPSSSELCGTRATCFYGMLKLQPYDMLTYEITESVRGGSCAFAAIVTTDRWYMNSIHESLYTQMARLPSPNPSTFHLAFANAERPKIKFQVKNLRAVVLLIDGLKDYLRATSRFTVTVGGAASSLGFDCASSQVLGLARRTFATCSDEIYICSARTTDYQIATLTTAVSSATIEIEYSPMEEILLGCSDLTYVVAQLLIDGELVGESRINVNEQRSRFVFHEQTSANLKHLADSVQVSASDIHFLGYNDLKLQKTWRAAPQGVVQNISLADVYAVQEATKHYSFSPTGSMACVLDVFTATLSNVECKFNVEDATYVAVHVAQTQFTSSQVSVSVSMGSRVVTCGGGRLFQDGTNGRSGLCDTYIPCFQGSLPTGTTEISIIFSQPDAVQNCYPGSVAVVTPRVIDASSYSCQTGEFQCPVDQSCLPKTRVCDGSVDCSDGTDESYCSSWKLVSRQQYPKCPTNRTLLSQGGLLSLSQCKALAVTYALSENTDFMAIVFNENQYCVAVTCMNPSSPRGTMVPFTPDLAFSLVYVYMEDASQFAMCSSEFSCNSHGTVSATTPPCVCTCAQGYVGRDCNSRKDMTVVNTLALAMGEELTDTEKETVKSLTEASLERLGAGGIEVTVTDYVITSDSSSSSSATTKRRRALDSLASTSKSTAQFYLLDMSSLGGASADRSAAVARFLTSTEQSDFSNSLETATGKQIVEITSPTVIVSTKSLSCFISHGNSATHNSCPVQSPSGWFPQTENVEISMLEITATFWGELSDYDVSLGADYPCDSETVSTSDSSCPYIVTCKVRIMQKSVNMDKIAFTNALTPRYSVPSTQSASSLDPPSVCFNTDGGSTTPLRVNVSFSYIEQVPWKSESTSSVTTDSVQSDDADTAVVGMIACGVACLVCLLALWYNVRNANRFKAAFFSTLFSLGVMAILVFGGVYLDGTSVKASHHAVFFEYRSSNCSGSILNPIPHRVSRVAADGECYRLEVQGTAEGSGYVKAKCAEGGTAGSFEGNVYFAFGESEALCKAAEFDSIKDNTCTSEDALFPTKRSTEIQFVEAGCLAEDVSNQAFAKVGQDYKPQVPLVETMGPSNTIPLMKFDGVDGRAHYYRGTHLADEVEAKTASGSKTFSITPTESYTKDPSNILVRWINDGSFEWPTEMSDGENVANSTKVFNQFSDELEFAQNSLRYFGVAGTPFDVGQERDFTLTMWVKIDQQSRGFLFALADNWFNRESLESPIITKVTETLQNGLGSDNYFTDTWNMYLGIYVDGVAKSIHLISASPTKESDDGYIEMIFDTAAPKVKAEAIFDGTWHHIAFAFSTNAGRRFAQLFVDGRTSYVSEGWRTCMPRGSSVKEMEDLPASVSIQSVQEETVYRDAVGYVGLLNGSVWGVQAHKGYLEQEKIIALGAPGMGKHATIDVNNSLLLGQVLLLCAAVGILLTIVFLCLGIHRASKREEATASARVGGVSRGGSSRGSSQLRYMIPIVLNVAQTMAIYFEGWKWPAEFEVNVSWVVSWLALDVNMVFPELPALVSPGIQVFVAVGVLSLIFAILGRDHEMFVERIKNKLGLPSAEIKPRFPVNYYMVEAGKKKLHAVTSAESPESLVRVIEKVIHDPGQTVDAELHIDSHPECVVFRLKGETAGKRSGVKVIAQTSSPNPLSNSPDTTYILRMKVSHTDKCPEHNQGLISALPDVHGVVKNESGVSPYECAYRCAAGVHYRKIMDPKVQVCPGRGEVFYVCPNDECSFCICTECMEGGTCGAGIGSKVYSLSRLGAMQILGFIVILIAQVVHMPIMKNALMIIYCHVTYQCDFPECYNNPTTMFLIFVAFAGIICLTMGIGLVYFLFKTAIRRKTFLCNYKEGISNGLFAEMDEGEWVEILEQDNSMMKTLYEPYNFKFMWVHPVTLIFKLMTVAPIVFASPNSLTQLTAAACSEGIQLLFFLILHPHGDHWLGFMTHVGSIHQVIQLGWMSHYRVAIVDNPNDKQYAEYMLYTIVAYVAVTIVTVIVAIVGPMISKKLREGRELKEKKKQAHLESQRPNTAFHGTMEEEEGAP